MRPAPTLAAAIVALAAVLAAGCGAPPGSPAAGSPSSVEPATSNPSTGTAPSSGPVGAADVDGPFRLELVLPRATWSTSEPVEAQATLRYLLPGTVELGGSGAGVLGYSALELDGTRRMDAAWQGDCARWPLGGGAPITTGLVKSGGWSGDDPNAAFYEAFFADPEYHLPAGRWLITAHAMFVEGPDFGGAQHELRASQEITVTD
jgi:hypothetical protein